MPQDKIFTEGLFFNAPRTNAPSFVIGSLSIKVPDLIPFLQKHELQSGYVNVDIKQSQKGGYYCELNTWKPTKSTEKVEEENHPIIDPNDGRDLSDQPF